MNSFSRIAFLVGPGRSGTTMLYKLLAAHPDIGYLNNYLSRWPGLGPVCLLNRLLRQRFALKRAAWFDDRGGAFFDKGRAWHKKLVPSPEECERTYQRGGMPLTPGPGWIPAQDTALDFRSRFESLRRWNGSPLLLSKRTANNRRIRQLDLLVPSSRYISLIRDGRAVAQSLLQVGWWEDHVLYWNGRSPRQLVSEGADPLELAARNWLQEMQDMQAGLAALQPEQVLEISYDALLRAPRTELARALAFLGVDPDSSEGYWQLIDSLELKPRPEGWITKWSPAQRRQVEAIQGSMLRALGFTVS